jgi:hypothetical protein
MESPFGQENNELHRNFDLQDDDASSPVRRFDGNSPSGKESASRLSPLIQGILNRGLAENLSRILSKASEPQQDFDSGYAETLECQQPTQHSSFSHLHSDDVNGICEETAKVDYAQPVADSIALLQELVFEWEDLYFQENDVVPQVTSSNLFVWGLCGRRPVPMSPECIQFGFGRVYIILHIKSFEPSPIMTCFYWTGHKAHFSSIACAAIHAIQLSRRIGCLKTSRQMEGIETVDFFDAIGKFSVVPSSSQPSLQVLQRRCYLIQKLMLHPQKYIPPLHVSFAVLCDLNGYARVEHRLQHAKVMIVEKDASHCVVVDCGMNAPIPYHTQCSPFFYFFFRQSRFRVSFVLPEFYECLSCDAFRSIHQARPLRTSSCYDYSVRWYLCLN